MTVSCDGPFPADFAFYTYDFVFYTDAVLSSTVRVDRAGTVVSAGEDGKAAIGVVLTGEKTYDRNVNGTEQCGCFVVLSKGEARVAVKACLWAGLKTGERADIARLYLQVLYNNLYSGSGGAKYPQYTSQWGGEDGDEDDQFLED